jgi:hypothetical protein
MAYPRFADWADEWYESIAAAAPEGMEVSLVAFDVFWTSHELNAP